MLKVTLKEAPASLMLILEGRLVDPWTGEVDKGWHDAIVLAKTKQMVIDLSAVSFVDTAGEQLLVRMLEWGATIRAEGVWMRHLVQQLRARLASQDALPSRRAPGPNGSPGAF